MADLFTDKSHPATPRRRQQARSQGHVAKSQDLVSALVMTGGLLALWIAGAGFGQFITDFATQQLSQPSWQSMTSGSLGDTWLQLLMATGRSMAPIMAIVMVVAIVANLGQTGFLFLPQRIALDFNRIQPMTGMRRLTSTANLVQTQFGLAKTVVVITVALCALWAHREQIMGLVSQDPQLLAGSLLKLLFTISLQVSFALVILALTDYAFQRWQYERSLRLSDDEMREELRNMQTDPQANARRQSAQQAMAGSQLEQLVRSCDLILTDNNSLAVALQCDPSTTSVPRVITKGQGIIAKNILATARATGILIEQQRQLANAIFREADDRQQISPSRFQALARTYQAAIENRPPGL